MLFVVGRCGGAVVIGAVRIVVVVVVVVVVAVILGRHYFLVQYETVIAGGTIISVDIPIHPGLLLLLLSLRILLIRNDWVCWNRTLITENNWMINKARGDARS